MTTGVLAPALPKPIVRLSQLAYNLWWSWHPEACELFRTLDYVLWKMSGNNPVRQLREISPDKLKAASADPGFLTLYDSVMAAFDADMSSRNGWFSAAHPNRLSGPVAYFSAEFAIHSSLPIYAGGLGILAGDICKEASDLGLPMVGVGLMYPQGYFHQRISAEGWQEEVYTQLDFDKAPVKQVLSPQGGRAIAKVQLDGRPVFLGVWRVCVGTTSLYLLDTNVPENTAEDRQMSARLYMSDREARLRQEIVLGMGGVRVLRALGIRPALWHANEGHTAFMMLERIREQVESGMPFDYAVRSVRSSTVFTTHTPVPAGHDVFHPDLMEKYFRDHWGALGICRDAFLELGQENGHRDGAFNMTAFALTMAEKRNAVSQLHGKVARQMWSGHWSGIKQDEIPIVHVTNGVHVPTWIAPEMDTLFRKYLGQDWVERHDDPALWRQVMHIPDDELWSVHQILKGKLLNFLIESVQASWGKGEVEARQVPAMGALLHPRVLTLGFVRRFTEYKRPDLIFRDIPRLKRIINDPWRPVQVVFAGKSHPADGASKRCLHDVCNLAADREFQGRIAFLTDHSMHTARYLVQGVDLWLNTPRRLQEACGTSGMKASLNGVPHFSISDGWWYEGYNGGNGWCIGDGLRPATPEEEDRADAESLYELLEQEIVPLFYDRDRKGIPHGWIRVIREAILSVVPIFCARRMVKDYTDQLYLNDSTIKRNPV